MDCHHLQIRLWKHLALHGIHKVCACVCVFASSGCLCLKTNLFPSSKLCRLQYVCYLSIKHAVTTWGLHSSIKIKVWVSKRDGFFSFFGLHSLCAHNILDETKTDISSPSACLEYILLNTISLCKLNVFDVKCYCWKEKGRDVLRFCCQGIASHLYTS